MIRRLVTLICGFTLIVLGAIITPLPIPVGLVLIIIGLALVIPALPGTTRKLRQWRRRFPALSARLNQIATYLPAFVRRAIQMTDPGAAPSRAHSKMSSKTLSNTPSEDSPPR
ncbi:MAG: hypothetical protein VXZ05_10325 [Pseudomonadota bacterium]|nr:hypothetical protein [Pseudomonadota bacterium]